jgi:chemotaxis protein histidine kinase CheA
MAGSDDDEFHDIVDPAAVQREHSQQLEAIQAEVAEDAAEAKLSLAGRLAKRAEQSFKRATEAVSSLAYVTPPAEQEMNASASAKKYEYQEPAADDAPSFPDDIDPADTDAVRAEFERSAASMERKQDETRMRIKQQAEERKASLKAKLALAREESAKTGVVAEADEGDEEANFAAKLVNIASIRQSEYDEAMSDRLPKVSDCLDYDEAKEEWKYAAVTDKHGKYLPVWRSTFADIEMLGTGIGLWFRTLKAMSLYFFVMSIPTMMILGNYLYLYYNPDSDLSEDTMEVLARLTTGVAATTAQTKTVAGWDIRTVMFAISVIDCFAVLVFLLLIAYLRKRQARYIEENDDAVISLPDYSVMVWGIPKDATEDEVSRHFERFGVVSDCAVVKDIGKVMGTRMKRSRLLDTLISLKIDAAYYEAKGRTGIGRVQTKRIDAQKAKIIKAGLYKLLTPPHP